MRGEGGADPLSPVEKASTPAGLGLATTLALLTAEGTAEGLSPATETSQLALAVSQNSFVCFWSYVESVICFKLCSAACC